MSALPTQVGPAGAGRDPQAVPEDVYASWSPAPSPAGDQVAFVSDRGGQPQVWFTGNHPGTWSPLPVRMGRVLHVTWSPDGEWVAGVTAAPGSSRHEVWLCRPDGRDLHLLAGREPATAVLGVGPRHGWTADGRLIVTETGPDGPARSWVVTPLTGDRLPVAAGRLLSLLDVSCDLRYGLLRRGPRGQRQLMVAELATGRLRELVPGLRPDTDEPSDVGSMDYGFFAADGLTVYCRSDVGRDRAALVAVPLGSGDATVLAARDRAELQDVTPTPDGQRLVLLWNSHGGRSALSVIEVATGRETPLEPLPRDVVDEVRVTADGRRVLLTAESWADPRGVWSVDLETSRSLPVSSTGSSTLRSSRGATVPTVSIGQLTTPQLREFRARDGLELSGWLYTPAGPGPWPTMLHLHGGPEAQERPVYNSLFQSVVHAGVAVFALNYRGSSGFGRVFVHADDLDRRPAATADVADCVAELTGAGVADPARIALEGRSYGGYLVLAALVDHPELFAAGVDICGISDFETFYAHTEPWIAAAATGEYGDPVRHRDLLRRLSPIHRIDRLRAPLLVVHGAEDTNVPVVEADQVVEALAARGLEHRYLLFPGEGHELLDTANRVRFVQETVDWVTRHLQV